MSNVAELKLDGKTYTLPVIEGTEKERAVCISSLRDETSYITLDDGYGNTGSCRSAITFIDGEKGHSAVSRHPDRGTGGAIDVRGSGPFADHGQAADIGGTEAVFGFARRETRCFTRT